MQKKELYRPRNLLCSDLLDSQNFLRGLVKLIPWKVSEGNFRQLYAASSHPDRPVWLMDGLFNFKQSETLNGDRNVEAWVQGLYLQLFRGQQGFNWKLSNESSGQICFRCPVLEDVIRKIFESSVNLYREFVIVSEIVMDSARQTKSIRFLADAKRLNKILPACFVMQSWKTSSSGAFISLRSRELCRASSSIQMVAGWANASLSSGACRPSPASWFDN